MRKAGMGPKDFTYVVFHQPNGKFPLNVGKCLGFTKDQIETGRLVPRLGNTYSGSSPLGLTAILDVAKPGDTVLMVSYGSGAGSDAFVFVVTDLIRRVQDLALKTREMIDSNKAYLDYGTYAKYRGKILRAD
jgi:hydroxymethylglutaryl-CoA synthase